jgi:hypothetical protein
LSFGWVKLMMERSRARHKDPCPTHRIQHDGSIDAIEIEYASGKKKDDVEGRSFPTPSKRRTSLNNNEDDVEKAALKYKNLDEDTERTEITEESDREHSPVWRSKQFLKLILSALIPFLFIVVISAVLGSVFSGSSDENIGNAAGSSLLSTQDMTGSPTSLSPTTTPPSSAPSIDPTDAPSIMPTLEPVVSDDFQVRLYWESGYYWQETYVETFYCMECASCASFTLNDGWEGECEVPSSTSASCQEGHQIWVRKCKDERRLYTFEIIKNFGTGDQIRVHGTDLCFSIVDDTYLELRPCDKNHPTQLFNPIEETTKFELRPYDQRDMSMKDANCLSQRHHPKDKEMVGLHQCETNYNHETNYWTEYHR